MKRVGLQAILIEEIRRYLTPTESDSTATYQRKVDDIIKMVKADEFNELELIHLSKEITTKPGTNDYQNSLNKLLAIIKKKLA